MSMHPVYKIMFFFSLGLVAVSLAATVYWGLPLGTDFRGGSLLEIKFDQQANNEISELRRFLNEAENFPGTTISLLEGGALLIRLPEIAESRHQQLLKDLQNKFGSLEERKFSAVGAVIGQELKRKSLVAVSLVLLMIVIFIAFVFRRLSRVLSPWAMGQAAILALAHDVLIPAGVFAWLGHYQGVEITAIFVAAVLTILGYSVSDTVVVFDRIRENVLRFGGQEKLAAVAQRSVRQTLVRSLNTTSTTILPLLAIYFLGGETLKYFALALIIGIFLGSYSSIFVAVPMLVFSARSAKPKRG